MYILVRARPGSVEGRKECSRILSGESKWESGGPSRQIADPFLSHAELPRTYHSSILKSLLVPSRRPQYQGFSVYRYCHRHLYIYPLHAILCFSNSNASNETTARSGTRLSHHSPAALRGGSTALKRIRNGENISYPRSPCLNLYSPVKKSQWLRVTHPKLQSTARRQLPSI